MGAFGYYGKQPCMGWIWGWGQKQPAFSWGAKVEGYCCPYPNTQAVPSFLVPPKENTLFKKIFSFQFCSYSFSLPFPHTTSREFFFFLRPVTFPGYSNDYHPPSFPPRGWGK